MNDISKTEPGESLVSDADINAAWGNANFGNQPRRKVIDDALFQIAGDYHTGYTAMTICQELGLVGKSRGALPRLTKKGKRYLYERYKLYSRPRSIEILKLADEIEESAQKLYDHFKKLEASRPAALEALEKLKNAALHEATEFEHIAPFERAYQTVRNHIEGTK